MLLGRDVTHLDLHIEVRRKLEVDSANPHRFHTVRKTGYRFTRG